MAAHQHAIAIRRLYLSIILAVISKKKKEKSKKKRAYQSEVNANRHKSQFFHLVQELWLASATDTSYFIRMTLGQFEALLNKVGPLIAKKNTHRLPISPGERLSMTLRFLASGDQQKSMSLNFRIGKSTMHYVVQETCEALWSSLKDDVLMFPSSKEEWKSIANGFKDRWNFPHCLGAIDGKHINMQAPPKSGSKFYNYKAAHRIVLMAACDSNYCFTFIDLGAPGRQSDGRVFAASYLGQMISNQPLAFPDPEPLEDGGPALPYVFVGDEAFPLKTNLMRPFPGKNLTERQKLYNYRLSRARRMIENCFGILSQRWQLFRSTIVGHPAQVESYVKAAIVLHNFLRKSDQQISAPSRIYCPNGYADSVDRSGNIKKGKWRTEAASNPSTNLIRSNRLGSNNHTVDAAAVRSSYMQYFSTTGAVPWQLRHVRYGPVRDGYHGHAQ